MCLAAMENCIALLGACEEDKPLDSGSELLPKGEGGGVLSLVRKDCKLQNCTHLIQTPGILYISVQMIMHRTPVTAAIHADVACVTHTPYSCSFPCSLQGHRLRPVSLDSASSQTSSLARHNQ